MKLLIGTVCLAFAVAVSAADSGTPVESPVYDYHRRFGIQEAARIKKFENDGAAGGQRIVGGSVTDISSIPYQAGLVIQLMVVFTSVCGASLISNERLLTAAHCQFDGSLTANTFTVVLGSNTLFSGGVRTQATSVVMHPEWNPFTVANDIAVITINPVTFSNVIRPIALPSTSYEINNEFVYWLAVASGYGQTSDSAPISINQVLSSVTLFTIDNESCEEDYGPFVRESNLCTSSAGIMGTCDGDSGGPLVVTSFGHQLLAGVSSFGPEAGCAYGPSVFTRVTSYLDWILSI